MGYIACAQELIEPLTKLKLFTCVAVPAFCERFVNTILVDGTYAGHMKQIQHKLVTQQALTQKALRTRSSDLSRARRSPGSAHDNYNNREPQ